MWVIMMIIVEDEEYERSTVTNRVRSRDKRITESFSPPASSFFFLLTRRGKQVAPTVDVTRIRICRKKRNQKGPWQAYSMTRLHEGTVFISRSLSP